MKMLFTNYCGVECFEDKKNLPSWKQCCAKLKIRLFGDRDFMPSEFQCLMAEVKDVRPFAHWYQSTVLLVIMVGYGTTPLRVNGLV